MKRNHALDVLRSVAILFIVGFWHPFASSKVFECCYTPATILLSFCALGLFCFISGFLLAKKHATGLESRNEVFAFYRRRLLRIYPLYAIALICFFLKGLISKQDFIAGLFVSGAVRNIDILTLWFVNMIMVLYLLTPIFLFRFTPKRNVFLVAGIYIALFFLSRARLIDPRLGHYFLIYSAGILVAQFQEVQEWVYKSGWKLLPVFATAGWLATHKLVLHDKTIRFILTDLSVLSSMPALLILGNWLSGILNERLFRFISYSAFSLYLFHRLIFTKAFTIYWPASAALKIGYVVGVVLPLAIVMSYLIQLIYDKALDALCLRLARVETADKALNNAEALKG